MSLDVEEDRTHSQLFKEYLDKAETLDGVVLVFTYRPEIEEIEQAYKACKEASIWLSNKRAELVEAARNLILENNIKRIDSIEVVYSPDQLDRFCQSINTYLLWIELYITKGSTPVLLPKDFIPSVLPVKEYVKAFEFIRDHKISIGNGLSNAAVTELRGYFNRFLIKPLLQ